MSNKKSNYLGKNPKKQPKFKLPCCPVCGASIKMIPEAEMNFRFHKDGASRNDFYWVCKHYPACNTYVAADNRTKRPFGTLAGPELRHKRFLLHYWEQALVTSGLYTRCGYRYMIASLLGIDLVSTVHVREFSNYQCDVVLDHLRTLYQNNEKINRMVESHPQSPIWFNVRGIYTGPNHNVLYDSLGNPIGYKNTDTPEAEAKRASSYRSTLLGVF